MKRNFSRGLIVPSDMLFAFVSILLSIFSGEWFVNRSVPGNFIISSPIALVHDSTMIATDVGEVQYHTYHCTIEEGEATFVYMVQYYTNEALAIYRDSAELLSEFFDATIEQSALSIGGLVMIKDDMRFKNRYPGRFWRIHYNGGHSVMKTQSFLIDDHFYLLQVAVDAKHSLSDDIDRFFESFKIIEQPLLD